MIYLDGKTNIISQYTDSIKLSTRKSTVFIVKLQIIMPIVKSKVKII